VDANEIFATLLTPEGLSDPYPLYAALHDIGEAIATDGVLLVPAFEVASAVLRDSQFRVPDAATFDEIWPGWRDHPSMSSDSILSLNQPEHGRIRSLMSRAFTQRRVAALEPAIADMTKGLLDDIAERGAGGRVVEFMHDFAFLLPVTVICELMGIPAADREGFRPLARALVATLEPMSTKEQWQAADAAAVQLNEYFTALAAMRRADPRDDLISALTSVNDARDGRLSDTELLDNLTLLLVAGFETTANLVGNGLRIVLQDPALADGLRDGAVPVAPFVEEVLRYDSPVQLTSRRARAPTEVAGHRVAPGEEIILMLGAANRDPHRFTEPGTFNPARADAGVLSFGAGAHFCVGSALARLEGAVAFPQILGRFPELAAAGEPVRKNGLVLRGYESLPVTVA
jgi:cytochrome P450